MNTPFCAAVAYIWNTGVQYGTYIICAMTFGKYFAVRYPHKAASFSTPRATKLTIATLFISCIIYNVPRLFSTKISSISQCDAYQGGKWTIYYYWLSFTVNGIIPLCLLIVLNVMIINEVRKRNKQFNNPSQGRGTMKSAEKQLTVMSILVTSAFLLLTTPLYIFQMLSFTINWSISPRKYAHYLLISILTSELYYTNSSVNFFLYCISGSKFRNDFKILFTCKSNLNINIHETSSETTLSKTTVSHIASSSGNEVT